MEQNTNSGTEGKAATVEQARKFLTTCPGAVSGERGIIQTFSAVVGLIHHFGLDDSTVFSLLSEWNATCIPPWSASDLWHMILSVRQIPCNRGNETPK
jgi:hypothetical protein